MNKIISFIKKHKLISIVSFIVLLILISLPFLLASTNGAVVYAVKSENLVNTILVNGTYTIASQTQVISPTNGIITKLFAANGAIYDNRKVLF